MITKFSEIKKKTHSNFGSGNCWDSNRAFTGLLIRYLSWFIWKPGLMTQK